MGRHVMQQAMQVLTSRATTSWYTPPEYIGMVRAVLGDIDLDPASDELPQTWIQADRYFTAEFDDKLRPTLEHDWYGRVWLNPPFDNSAAWVKKLIEQFEKRTVTEAILLVNSNLGYKWYEDLWTRFPVCCVRERIRFVKADGTIGGQSKRGQTFVLFTHSDETLKRFISVFGAIGRIILPQA